MATSRRESPVSIANIKRLWEQAYGPVEQYVSNNPPELQARIDAAEQRSADARATRAAAKTGRKGS